MSASSRALARGGMIVSVAYLVSHVLGFVRVFAINGTASDAAAVAPFWAAFRIPDLIFQLVAAGALGSALLPTVAALMVRDEQARAWRVVSAVANLMLIALAVLASLLLLVTPAAVRLVVPNFTGEAFEQTVTLTRIMLLSPIILAMGSVATTVLNARGRFAASVAAPVCYNLGIIAGALVLQPAFGLVGLALGVVIGALCHLGIQLRPLLATGFRYSPTLARDDPETRRTVLLLVPRAIGLGGAQLQLAAATAIGSTLTAGALAIAAFNVAFPVFQIPIGVLGVPLGIVALPTLSAQFASGALDDFVDLVGRSLRLVVFFMVPFSVFGIIGAGEVMTALFGLGRTPTDQLALFGSVLAAFLLALPSEAAIVVLARAFYAMRDTRTAVGAALLAAVVSVAVSLVVAPLAGAPGLALGIAIASWVEVVVLVALLGRRVPQLPVGAVVRAAVAFGVCGAVAGAVFWAILAAAHGIVTPGPGRLVIVIVNAVELLLGGLVAGLVYLGAARALNLPEGPTIVRLVRSALRRGPSA